jgi:hypothetical protein
MFHPPSTNNEFDLVPSSVAAGEEGVAELGTLNDGSSIGDADTTVRGPTMSGGQGFAPNNDKILSFLGALMALLRGWMGKNVRN